MEQKTLDLICSLQETAFLFSYGADLYPSSSTHPKKEKQTNK